MGDTCRRGFTVTLYGLQKLESSALASLISRVAKTIVVDNPADGDGGFAIFLTSAEGFLTHLDFFLPRKARTVVFTDSALELPCPKISRSSDPETLFSLLQELAKPDEDQTEEYSLTQREKDVLRLIATGLTNKEIADELNISVNTVITHRKNVTQKLGIRSASGLSLYALMNGLI